MKLDFSIDMYAKYPRLFERKDTPGVKPIKTGRTSDGDVVVYWPDAPGPIAYGVDQYHFLEYTCVETVEELVEHGTTGNFILASPSISISSYYVKTGRRIQHKVYTPQ